MILTSEHEFGDVDVLSWWLGTTLLFVRTAYVRYNDRLHPLPELHFQSVIAPRYRSFNPDIKEWQDTQPFQHLTNIGSIAFNCPGRCSLIGWDYNANQWLAVTLHTSKPTIRW